MVKIFPQGLPRTFGFTKNFEITLSYWDFVKKNLKARIQGAHGKSSDLRFIFYPMVPHED